MVLKIYVVDFLKKLIFWLGKDDIKCGLKYVLENKIIYILIKFIY